MNHATSRRDNRDISTSLDNIPDTCPICHHSIEPLDCAKAKLADVDFSDRIKRVSGKFCGIYNEAQRAEQLGLSQLCEAGYRQSLEFLIRDYVSMLHKGRQRYRRLEKRAGNGQHRNPVNEQQESNPRVS